MSTRAVFLEEFVHNGYAGTPVAVPLKKGRKDIPTSGEEAPASSRTCISQR